MVDNEPVWRDKGLGWVRWAPSGRAGNAQGGCWRSRPMGMDGPEDPGPLAAIELEHGGGGTQISPVVWMLVIAGALLVLSLLFYLR